MIFLKDDIHTWGWDSESTLDTTQSLFFYMLPLSPHLTICLSIQSCTLSLYLQYIHALFILLSADTAIINHGKEHSRSRLLAVGPASFAQSDHRFKQISHWSKNTTLKRTSPGNSSRLPPSVLTDLLQPDQWSSPNWIAWQTACCHVTVVIRSMQVKSNSNLRPPLKFRSRSGWQGFNTSKEIHLCSFLYTTNYPGTILARLQSTV